MADDLDEQPRRSTMRLISKTHPWGASPRAFATVTEHALSRRDSGILLELAWSKTHSSFADSLLIRE